MNRYPPVPCRGNGDLRTGNAAICDIADFILADSKRKFTTPLTAQRSRLDDGDE